MADLFARLGAPDPTLADERKHPAVRAALAFPDQAPNIPAATTARLCHFDRLPPILKAIKMHKHIKCIVWMAHLTLAGPGTSSAADVAVTLNHRGIRSSVDKRYVPGARGIYTVIRHVWRRLQRSGRFNDADAVARAFTKADGTYAYL